MNDYDESLYSLEAVKALMRADQMLLNQNWCSMSEPHDHPVNPYVSRQTRRAHERTLKKKQRSKKGDYNG